MQRIQIEIVHLLKDNLGSKLELKKRNLEQIFISNQSELAISYNSSDSIGINYIEHIQTKCHPLNRAKRHTLMSLRLL